MASTYTLSVIAAWYFSNIGVILLNKYLLSIYGFRYPIFLTMMHMVRAHAILPIEVLATLKTTIDGLGLGHRAGLPPAPFAHRPGFLCRAH